MSKTFLSPLPENPEDEALLDQITDAGAGCDGYWERRVEAAFEGAGFTICNIQREEAHQTVWAVSLSLNSVELVADKKGAAKQIRKLIVKAGLGVRPNELSVIDR